MKTQQVTVTPQMAEAWLLKNESNRSLRKEHVAALASDMKNGRFLLTGEALKFDNRGNLLDGQHRLSAVVKAGVPVEFLVVTDLEEDVFRVLDTGAKRTVSDALGKLGHNNSKHLATAARIGINYERGAYTTVSSSGVEVSSAEIIAWVDQHPGIHDCVAFMRAKKYERLGRSAATGAFALYVLRDIDAAAADSFLQAICSSTSYGEGDPKNALIRKLQNVKIARQPIRAAEELYLIFRTWNAIRANEQLQVLKYSTGSANTPATSFLYPLP